MIPTHRPATLGYISIQPVTLRLMNLVQDEAMLSAAPDSASNAFRVERLQAGAS